MSTRHLVDPELLPFLELAPIRELNRDTLAAARIDSATRFDFLPEPELTGDRSMISGPDGDIEVVVMVPPGDGPRGGILHCHGGGMVLGSAWGFRRRLSTMALETGCVIVSVEYRLAPETPFPGPQEDCYAALRWFAERAASYGVDPARIVIAGESAGGGLAAAVALMARDRGGPALAGQVLVFPMLDDRTGGQDCPYRNPVTGEFVWNGALNQFGWGCLRGDYDGSDDRLGWFAPVRAGDFSGLPPTWIGTGSLDLFLDENLVFAQRLAAAAVPVELHSYPGAVHGFPIMTETRIGREFARDHLAAMRRLTA
jgi:acetyl esterase